MQSQSLDVLQQLLPHSDRSHIDKYLLRAASTGDTNTVLLSAGYSSTGIPSAVAISVERGHLELANTLMRLYPSKESTKSALLASIEREDLDLIREFVKFAGIESIDAAIFMAAGRRKFEIVEMLLEHASQSTIKEVAGKMIGKELASAVFAKALTYISGPFSGLIYQASEAADRNSLQALLPFMTLKNVELDFLHACKKNGFATVSLLSSFTKSAEADSCFKTLVDRKSTPAELLEQLLPQMSREAVFEVHKSPGKEDRLKESTLAVISKRVEGFPTEIAFEHAFRAGSEFYFETSSSKAEEEAQKYGVELPTLCTSFEECAKVIQDLPRASISTVAVEKAITFTWESFDYAIDKAGPLLVPFASPFTCTYLLWLSPNVLFQAPELASVCAEKVLESAVVAMCEGFAPEEEKLAIVKMLIHRISPSTVFSILQSRWVQKSQQTQKIVDMLSESQVDKVLSLATRKYADAYREEDAPLLIALLKKASKPAVDASLLHVNRYRRPIREIVKVLSKYATEEGRKEGEQLAKAIV